MNTMTRSRNVLLYLLVAVHLLGLVSLCFADFKDVRGGVRPTGMGGAFVGVADDTNTLFLNPAGLARLEFSEIGYSYGRNYPDNNGKKTANYFSFILPFGKKAGTMGLGWRSYSFESLSTENTFLLGYARNINDLFPFVKNPLYIGTNIKALCVTADDTNKDIFDELFDSNNTEADIDFDLAMLYNSSGAISFGIVGKNMVQPTINNESVKREVVLGTKLNTFGEDFFGKGILNNVSPAFDLRYRDRKWKGHLGLETWFFNYMLGARVGANDDEATCGITLGGISTKYFDLQIDYAFAYDLVENKHEKTHFIGFSLSGKAPAEKETKDEGEQERIPYLLGPKDEIQIFVRRHEELSGNLVVNPEGKISLPLLGDVYVTDLSKDEIAEKMRNLLTKYIENPDVVVNIVTYRSKEFYVLGEVRSPGKYSMEGSVWTLKDAIAQAGFPTGLAATWRVYIITPRTKEPIYQTVNLYKILYLGKTQQNIQLKPGDIVYVPSTVLGKISSSLSHLVDPFFKTRDLATPVDEESLLKTGVK
ncbi:MAG: polysaccharide biosynthesis/export family protein [bacterium]